MQERSEIIEKRKVIFLIKSISGILN